MINFSFVLVKTSKNKKKNNNNKNPKRDFKSTLTSSESIKMSNCTSIVLAKSKRYMIYNFTTKNVHTMREFHWKKKKKNNS